MIYRSLADINIYDSPNLDRLATQMATGRYLVVIDPESNLKENHLKIQLLEDSYEGWLDRQDLVKFELSSRQDYLANLPAALSTFDVSDRLPQVIAYVQKAMATPNRYLWGGTVAPNYDCSGLMQSAFASVGVWIPRDAYQQEAFGAAVLFHNLIIGDLIFFGTQKKATHVGIYIGDDKYIHSSGREHGHNCIAISDFAGLDPVSKWYSKRLRKAARIKTSLVSS